MDRTSKDDRPILTIEFEIEPTDAEWKELGYDPDKISENDIESLMEKIGELNQDSDFMPLLRRAARALGKNVIEGDSKDETTDS